MKCETIEIRTFADALLYKSTESLEINEAEYSYRTNDNHS